MNFDGQYRETSLSRDTWKSLIGSEASLQDNCDKEGFNAAVNDQFSKARIGIITNTQKECESCDSRIGFGKGGSPDNSNTCGVVRRGFPKSNLQNLVSYQKQRFARS